MTDADGVNRLRACVNNVQDLLGAGRLGGDANCRGQSGS